MVSTRINIMDIKCKPGNIPQDEEASRILPVFSFPQEGRIILIITVNIRNVPVHISY
jgi:hypothetical protein